MARIRTIKPEFPEDEKLGGVSRDARLLFILLWTICDDHGHFRAAPVYLRNSLFPYDEDASMTAVKGWLSELTGIGRVHLYSAGGENYGEVANWSKHQRIDNAGKEIYPPPSEADQPPSGDLGESRRNSASCGDLRLDLDHDLDHDRSADDPPSGLRRAGDAGNAAFEAWWAEYPRKVAKKDARRHWDKAIKSTTPEHLTAALRAVAKTWRGRPIDKIPHPSTWLSQGRWDDDVRADRKLGVVDAGGVRIAGANAV